jgi:uncharacterized protein YdeI (YjbR/CyaY-like superfamily)
MTDGKSSDKKTIDKKTTDEKTIEQFADSEALRAWLEVNHGEHPGIWLKIAKKSASVTTVNYDEAVDAALCYGWIDGKKIGFDAEFFLQSFTRRRARSVWSKRNIDKVAALIEARAVQPAGLAQIEAAKADGRWDRAYAGSSEATPLPEFLAALDANPAAKQFYETLNSVNRYALYFRIHSAKREDTRARRIATFVDMLARGEKLH